MSSTKTTISLQDTGKFAGAHNHEFLDLFRKILEKNLSKDFPGIVEFFSNTHRLDIMRRLMRQYFHCGEGTVLNIGSGVFATELFVDELSKCRFVSFDYTRDFAKIFPILRKEGKLGKTSFFIGDALNAEFKEEVFDIVLMHDLLYENALNLTPLLNKYDAYIRPGGLIFLDVMDIRARRLWKLLGREKEYHRYNIPDVLNLLRESGYEVLEVVPNLGAQKGFPKVLRAIFWYTLGIVNSHAIIARKVGKA